MRSDKAEFNEKRLNRFKELSGSRRRLGIDSKAGALRSSVLRSNSPNVLIIFQGINLDGEV